MNLIAAMIILNTQYEEDAFWCLVHILMPPLKINTHNKIEGLHNWRMIFVPTMDKALELE